MKNLPKFSVVESTAEVLTIRDTGHADGCMSVTNGAEKVVDLCHQKLELGKRRLFYYDSDEQLDELRHNGKGMFLGFGSAS